MPHIRRALALITIVTTLTLLVHIGLTYTGGVNWVCDVSPLQDALCDPLPVCYAGDPCNQGPYYACEMRLERRHPLETCVR